MSYLLGKIIRSKRVTEWKRACLADTSLGFDSQYYNQQINVLGIWCRTLVIPSLRRLTQDCKFGPSLRYIDPILEKQGPFVRTGYGLAGGHYYLT